MVKKSIIKDFIYLEISESGCKYSNKVTGLIVGGRKLNNELTYFLTFGQH